LSHYAACNIICSGNIAGIVAVFYRCAILVNSGNASDIGGGGTDDAGKIARVIGVLYVFFASGIISGDTADVLGSADGSGVVTVSILP